MKKAEQQSAIANAAGTIRLGGRTYMVGAPSDSDMRSVSLFLAKRIKSGIVALVESPAWGKLTEGQQDRLLAREMNHEPAAADGQPVATVDTEEAMKILTSLDGCRFLAWLLIRKKHPEITKEEIDGAIDEANAETVFIELDEASGMFALGNSAGRPGSATAN